MDEISLAAPRGKGMRGDAKAVWSRLSNIVKAKVRLAANFILIIEGLTCEIRAVRRGGCAARRLVLLSPQPCR